MLFCSQAYLVFFSCVLLAYWLLPWDRARVWLLLAASFCFYACWNRWFACLIAASTVVDYALARLIDSSHSPRLRRLLLTLSVAANLGLLAYFKYANFFLESLQAALSGVGMTSSLPVLSVILPVGISFYTFEAINYVVDVHRRRAPAERDLANFMLFITFFPHLVAGPIVRAKDFLPQARRPKRWDWARAHLGAQFLLMGLFKKLAVADRMAAVADPVFAAPSMYTTHTLWLAVLAYALQIYGDFSGYTDMAIGSAHLLGYKLAQNFDMPYLSRNISEFWRRWHISLSNWLRDYLFFPLGGSQGGRWRTCRNLLITMTLAGLWHGANWTYVLFGAVHGLLLSGHRLFREWAQARPGLDRLLGGGVGAAACVAATFLTFCLTLVVFRAPTLASAGLYFHGLLLPGGGPWRVPAHPHSVLLTALLVGLCHAAGLWGWHRWLLFRVPAPALGVGYAVLLTCVMVTAPASGKAFIYFQF